MEFRTACLGFIMKLRKILILSGIFRPEKICEFHFLMPHFV